MVISLRKDFVHWFIQKLSLSSEPFWQRTINQIFFPYQKTLLTKVGVIAFLKGNSCPWTCWIHGLVKLGIQCWFGAGIHVQQLCVRWVPSSSNYRDPSNSNQALYADLFKVSCGLTVAPSSHMHFIEPNICWGKILHTPQVSFLYLLASFHTWAY